MDGIDILELIKSILEGNEYDIDTFVPPKEASLSIQLLYSIVVLLYQLVHSGSGGSATWGNIGGTINNQSDLMGLFNDINEWQIVDTFDGVSGDIHKLYILITDCVVDGTHYSRGFYTWDSINSFVLRTSDLEVDNITININSSGELEIKDGGLEVKHINNTALAKSTDSVRDYTDSVDTKLTTEKFLQKTLQNIENPVNNKDAVNKQYVDELAGRVMQFKGFVSSTEPTGTIAEGSLWYENTDLPSAFPINVKTYTNNAWSLTTTQYTPNSLDLWSNLNNENGYYWFGNKWNLIDENVLVDNTSIDKTLQGELEVKNGGISWDKLDTDLKSKIPAIKNGIPVSNPRTDVIYRTGIAKIIHKGDVAEVSLPVTGVRATDDSLVVNTNHHSITYTDGQGGVWSADYILDATGAIQIIERARTDGKAILMTITSNPPYSNINILIAYNSDTALDTPDKFVYEDYETYTIFDLDNNPRIISDTRADSIPIIDAESAPATLLSNNFYRIPQYWWNFNGNRFNTSLIYKAYKFITSSYYADVNGVYEGNTLYATWAEINTDPVSWWANMVSNNYAEETTIEDGACVAIIWLNNSSYVSSWYGNFTKEIRVNLYQVVNGELVNITPRLSIDDKPIEENSTHMSLGIIGVDDIHIDDSVPPKQTGMDFYFGQGSNPDPDIIQDGQTYRYSNTKTSSNNYINTQLDNIKSMAEGSNKTYFITYPNSLPSAGNRNLNAYYYVQQGSATGTNYKKWFIDSTDVAHDLGTTQIDISTLVSKSLVVVPSPESIEGQVADAKGVCDNFAPLSASCVRTNSGVNIQNACFNFSNQIISGGSGRQVECKYFMQVGIPDPITSSETMYGYVKVEQSLVSNYEARIIQTFTSTFHNDGSGMEGYKQKVFRRVGVISSRDADIIYNPGTNYLQINWQAWYPLEYPRVSLTKLDSATIVTDFLGYCEVSGGIMHIDIRRLKVNATVAPNNGLHICTYPNVVRKGDFVFGMLYPLGSTLEYPGGVQAINDGEIEVFGLKPGIRYLGNIDVPLGY